MRPAQRRRERDAGPGDLNTGRVRKLQRRGDSDRGAWARAASPAASAAGARRNHRGLLVRAVVDDDGLAKRTRHLVADQARDRIGAAAGRIRHHQRDLPRNRLRVRTAGGHGRE